VYALCSAVLFLAGWVAQTSLWFACYGHGSKRYYGCPEHWLMYRYYGPRCAFSMVILLLYLTYLVFAAMATHRWRRQRQQRQRRSSVVALVPAVESDGTKLRDGTQT
jgi:hypothetical protein